MKFQVIKFRDIQKSYSIIIGNNALSLLPQKIRELCPKTKKVAIIIDRKVPKKFIKILKEKLKHYSLTLIKITISEKAKSLKTVNLILNVLLKKTLIAPI